MQPYKTMETIKKALFRNIIRAAKIGLAGVASILVARLCRLPQSYWAAISAFVVMGSDVNTTIAASRDRLIGTAIGAVMGAVFVGLLGSDVVWFGVAAVATVLICESFGLGQSYRLACVTVAIVMLVNNDASPWKRSGYRFMEVALGIVIALLASALPPKSVDNPTD